MDSVNNYFISMSIWTKDIYRLRLKKNILSLMRKRYGTLTLPYTEIEPGDVDPEIKKNFPFSATRLK